MRGELTGWQTVERKPLTETWQVPWGVLQKERLVTATLNNHKYTKESASELFMGQYKPPIQHSSPKDKGAGAGNW